MNDAPTQGYEKHVGRRTSVRVVAHSSLDHLLRNRQNLLRPDQDSVYVFWGPSSLMGRQGLVYRKLRGIKRALPQLNVYTITQKKMQQLDTLFKEETGMDRWDKSVCVFFLSLASLGPEVLMPPGDHVNGEN